MTQAPQPLAAGATANEPERTSALAKVYALPLLGYSIRIVAAIFNLPKIIANLQQHYSRYEVEIRRLNLLVVEGSHKAHLAECATEEALLQIDQLSRRLEELSTRHGLGSQDDTR